MLLLRLAQNGAKPLRFGVFQPLRIPRPVPVAQGLVLGWGVGEAAFVLKPPLFPSKRGREEGVCSPPREGATVLFWVGWGPPLLAPGPPPRVPWTECACFF